MATPRICYILVASLMLALCVEYRYLRQRRCPQPSFGFGATFSSIDLRTFNGQQKEGKNPFYEFILAPNEDKLTIQEFGDTSSLEGTLQTVLHAHLTGPLGEHFGCFLSRFPNGTHYCPESMYLAPGKWAANVTLVRSPKSGALSGCKPDLLRQQFIGAESISTIDYIIENNLRSFVDYKNCFRFPMKTVLVNTWVKKTVGILPTNAAKPVCASAGGPGVWEPYNKPCKKSNKCTGQVWDEIVDRNYNVKKGIRHVFVPFSCRPNFFTPEEANKCARRLGLVLAGDSRTYHLSLALEKWIGKDAIEFLNIYKPYHLGLPYMLFSNATQSGDSVRRAIKEGRAVALNSMLHDVAEFHRLTTVKDVAHSYSKLNLVDCEIDPTCESKLALKCGCRKTWAVQTYLNSIAQLKEEIIAMREEARVEGYPELKLYWISVHRRPPAPKDQLFHWQTSDVLWELESRVAAELEEAGVQHIDLRHMTTAAPEHWWDDPVHYGKIERKSLFVHGTLQALMSQICTSYPR